MAGSEDEMEQDAGLTELDFRRKKVASYSQGSESEWDKVSMGYPTEAAPFVPESSYNIPVPEEPDSTKMSRFVQETQGVIRPSLHAKIEVREVSSFLEVQPKNLKAMKGYELQAECDRWGVQTSGSKNELLQRLQELFSGAEVPKKRCSVQFLKLVEENPEFDRGPRSCPQRGEASSSNNVQTDQPGPRSLQARGQAALQAMEAENRFRASARPLVEIGVKDLVPGQPIGGLRCAKCNALMVPRRNRSNGNWFFSCEETFKRGCDFTRPLHDGLDIINGKLDGSKCFPRGSSSTKH